MEGVQSWTEWEKLIVSIAEATTWTVRDTCESVGCLMLEPDSNGRFACMWWVHGGRDHSPNSPVCEDYKTGKIKK